MNAPALAIIGIGIHPFGRTEGVSGRAQAVHAVRAALADAGLGFGDMQFGFGGSWSAGDPDTLVSELGLTSLPFMNVANGCATGGSALISADAAIRAGLHDVGLVVGFDKHPRGAFNTDPASHGIGDWYGETGLMLTTQFFGLKIQRYLHVHGIGTDVLAAIAEKAFRNGALNPNAWRRKEISAEEIASAPMISHPLTQYMYCSPGEGAVAFVVCRADRAPDYTDNPVYLSGAALRSRRYGSFEVFSPWLALDAAQSPTVDAAAAAFAQAGLTPADVDVAQVQDTESGAELMHMAETGLCEHGAQEELIASGGTALDGRLPINTDGGCIANGEPIGASGLRQVYETALQLRGEAGDHQVPGGPRVGFTHVYGAPGISACTVLTR
ncbi:Propanoyl-CoA C-acyltransferase [Pseudonocardia dioxanivorans CB1190]|uniref:Propanoyl-CoA C-acyltransferase n=1 Tax=Pseudonocardia dioxanivorans (strain ATCC 55486 / DSM 44775 / JCM 13855 / CB1190) TaxID=675635 RepID=F4CNY1_PSEUX|nr:thiolase family protein [Pseudonocardia dioxanivorans]AEA22786.1 Propanoyl-CoA C-acyltransferase [Pseudonocardia dioxanivorans CB1190]